MRVLTPSEAVTAVVMVLGPTANAMGADAVPDATAVPFTVTVEPDAATAGVIFIEVIALSTYVE